MWSWGLNIPVKECSPKRARTTPPHTYPLLCHGIIYMPTQVTLKSPKQNSLACILQTVSCDDFLGQTHTQLHISTFGSTDIARMCANFPKFDHTCTHMCAFVHMHFAKIHIQTCIESTKKSPKWGLFYPKREQEPLSLAYICFSATG